MASNTVNSEFVNVPIKSIHLEVYSDLSTHVDDVFDSIEGLRKAGYKVSISTNPDGTSENVSISWRVGKAKKVYVAVFRAETWPVSLQKAALFGALVQEFGGHVEVIGELKNLDKERDKVYMEYIESIRGKSHSKK